MADGGRRGEGAPPGDVDLVEAALREDVGDGDRTTEWSVPEGARGEAVVVAREEGVIAGLPVASRVFRRLSGELEVRAGAEDGRSVAEGDAVLRLRGPLAPILTGERTALNFLAHLSGVATLTRRFVEAVAHTGCRVTDTRKTTPGWRRLEKAATRAGGAVNHRTGLYDMVLLKENHIRAAGGVEAALAAVRERADREGVAVEVEVESVDQLERALAGGPDRVLLDNMSLSELRTAVERARSGEGARPELEASGGIDLESAPAVAETGVDWISVGRLTHSAPALDLTLLVDHVEER
ncbi:MAG: carboxylating nicotinate-nucleotide diphosphorylase [Gemmatimonadota bacterium]